MIVAVLGLGHHRMGVRAAAGLHLADLQRAARSEMSKMRMPRKRSLLTSSLHALAPAIDAAARLLDRHDQEIADDRKIALPAGADGRADAACGVPSRPVDKG